MEGERDFIAAELIVEPIAALGAARCDDDEVLELAGQPELMGVNVLHARELRYPALQPSLVAPDEPSSAFLRNHLSAYLVVDPGCPPSHPHSLALSKTTAACILSV